MENSTVSSTENDNEMGINNFNKLPDSLISSIISLLPIQEAVATSLICRRWKNLWKLIIRLEFDPRRMFRSCVEELKKVSKKRDLKRVGNQIELATSLIDEIIMSQLEGDVRSLKILHFVKEWRSGLLKKWIDYLKQSKGLEELSLTWCVNDFSLDCDLANDNVDTLPEGIFYGKRLRVLELNNYQLSDESPFMGCVNLETLKLCEVNLSRKTLRRILKSCIFLQNFTLNACERPQNMKGPICLEIRHDKLKSFEIQDMKLNKLDVRAGDLTVLKLHDVEFFNRKLISIDCPCLKEFKLYDQPQEVTYLLQRCSGLMIPDRNSKSCQHVKDLQVLCTTLDLNNMSANVLLAYIFRVWRSLQKLHIINQVDEELALDNIISSVPNSESTFWDRWEVPNSISNNLRFVTLRGFRGKESEIRFVSHLIKNAKRLKQVEIQCHDSCSRIGAAITFNLLFVSRASSNVSIVLKPGKEYMKKVGSDHFQKWMSTL